MLRIVLLSICGVMGVVIAIAWINSRVHARERRRVRMEHLHQLSQST